MQQATLGRRAPAVTRDVVRNTFESADLTHSSRELDRVEKLQYTKKNHRGSTAKEGKPTLYQTLSDGVFIPRFMHGEVHLSAPDNLFYPAFEIDTFVGMWTFRYAISMTLY